MAWANVIGRMYGLFGLGSSALGFAGWREDARVLSEWAKLNPGEAGILIGAGGVMVATYLVWETVNVVKWLRRGSAGQSQPHSGAFVQNFHGNVGTVIVDHGGVYRAPIEGSGELVSTEPIRIGESVSIQRIGRGEFETPPAARLTRNSS